MISEHWYYTLCQIQILKYCSLTETHLFNHVYVTNCLMPAIQVTHTHPFNGPLSGTTQVSRYQKGKTNLDFTKARDSEWQWHQLGHMQVCTALQTDNHASTPPLSFLQAGCPSCRPTNSVKALKVTHTGYIKCYKLSASDFSSHHRKSVNLLK